MRRALGHRALRLVRRLAVRSPRAGLQLAGLLGGVAASRLAAWKLELEEDVAELLGPLDSRQLRRIRRGLLSTRYRNQVLFEIMCAQRLDRLLRLITVADADPLLRLHARGIPIIVAGWHQGPAWIASTALRKLGLPALYAVSERTGEPDRGGDLVRYGDLRHGRGNVEFMKRAHDALRTGTIVGLHVDWRQPSGEVLSFLGRRVLVARGAASLARLTGARVVPVTRRFVGAGGRMEVRFHDPIEDDDLDPGARETFESILLDRIVRRLEGEALRDPASFRVEQVQWLLSHPPVIEDLRQRVERERSAAVGTNRLRVRKRHRENWEKRWGDAHFTAPWLGRGVSAEIEQAVADGWFPAGERVLDVGCGDGGVAAWLADRGYRAVGVDIAEAAVERARRTFGEQSGKLSFARVDLCECPAPGGPFAVIVDRGCFLQIPQADRRRYARHLAASCERDARLLVFDRAFRDGVAYDDPDEALRKQAEILAAFGAYFELERAAATYLDANGGGTPETRLPGMVFWLRRRAN